jgi:cobalt-zinc-cadmium efflux system outer membrane protein
MTIFRFHSKSIATYPALALTVRLGSVLLCGALLASLPQPSPAQTPESQTDITVVSIDDLVNAALTHNASLKAARRGIDAASAAVVTASAFPNPRIEINGGRNTTPTPTSSAGNISGVGISQLIENPFLRQARSSGAQYAEQGSRQSFAMTRNELVAQVRLRAYEYLLRRLQAQEAAESLSLLEQTRERIKVRVETGETGKLDLIRADAEIVNASQREQTARLQIAQAATTLNRLAAGMLPSRWELDAELDEAFAMSTLEQMKLDAASLNPEVRLLEAELARSKARIDEANASLLPGVELRMSQLREPDRRQEMVGVSVQIPLFDQKRGPRAEAIAERERTIARLEGRRAELMQQLELAWRAVEISNVRVKALSEGAVRSSEAALRVAEAAYRYGERGILEVLDAQRVLRSVRQDLLLARYELKAAQIELEALSGRYASER